jgi:excisionase family DNA binding protein
MGYLTIREVMNYTGYSRQTIMAYLESGRLNGRKTGEETSPWLIPADEVEELRQERIRKLNAKIKAISDPVTA